MTAPSSSPMKTATDTGRWEPDPSGRYELRWWDGTNWTEHVAQAGQPHVDPLGTAPTPEYRAAPAPSSPAAGQRRPGSRALPWGAGLGAVGLILAVVGSGMQNEDGTSSVGVGLLMGIGGWLIIAGVITVIVGLVARSRSR